MTRVACFSGGSVHGAIQVGMLKSLLNEKKPWYQAFCGVSVGAVNSIYLSQYTTRQSINGLVNLWEGLTDDQVKKNWFFGKLSLLWKRGMYDTSPLRETIEKNFDRQRLLNTGNMLRIGAVNLSTFEYELFDENYPDIVSAVMGSSAFPITLDATKIGNHYYTDGGVRNVTPIKAALDIPGVTEIDVFLADKLPEPQDKPIPKNGIEVGLATLQAVMAEVTVNDLKLAKLYNDLVKRDISGYRHKKHVKIRVFQPTEAITHDPMQFDHEPIMDMMNMEFKCENL